MTVRTAVHAACSRLLRIALMLGVVIPPAAADEMHARYLANAGVLVRHADAAVVFDPLFRNDYGTYELVPPDIERALFAGEAPWHDIDAVFISHHHGDHFDPAVMLDFLKARQTVRLFAPSQAADAIVASGAGAELGSLRVEAVRVPHSGWPERMGDVENIAWRVTLDGEATVLHLGDADTRPAHYELHPGHWATPVTDLALPPYWYFLSPRGRSVLQSHLKPGHAIGVHVPAEVPDAESERPAEFAGVDLFTKPGELRSVEAHQDP